MLIYTKVVNGVKKLYGTVNDVPADTDNALVYKDYDGDVITNLTDTDIIIENGSNGKIQRIKRVIDDKVITVYIKKADNTLVKIIGDDPVTPKVVKSIRVATKPTKVEYAVNDALDLTGIVVKVKYMDGDEEAISEGYTTSPANGAQLTEAGEVTVTVTHTASEKTASFKVTVKA